MGRDARAGRAIKAQRPDSLATQFLNYPGMTPPRVATVLETRDLGSLTGALGQPVTDAAGGGLDGIPDVQRAQLEGFSKTTAQQFNTRVDYSVTQNDRLAFSMYYVPVNTRSNDAGANSARPHGRLPVRATEHGRHAALDAHAVADDDQRGALQRDAVVLRRDRVEPGHAVGVAATAR